MNRSPASFPKGRHLPGRMPRSLAVRAYGGADLGESAGMQYPLGKDFALTDSTVAGTTHTVNLPTCEAGDILIAAVAVTSAATVTSLAGFTAIQNGSENTLIWWGGCRLCDGTEGATATLTVSASVIAAVVVTRVQGGYAYSMAGSDVPKFSFKNSARNPNSLIPGRHSCKFCWVYGGYNAVSSNHSDPGDADYYSGNAGSSTVRVAMATRKFYGSTFDPATFGSGTSNNAALTIAIPPKDLYV